MRIQGDNDVDILVDINKLLIGGENRLQIGLLMSKAEFFSIFLR